jgi:hypothetical protein
VQEVFGFGKQKLTGAQRRKDAASGERGAQKRAAALVPAQRSESEFNGLVNTTVLIGRYPGRDAFVRRHQE